MPDFNDVFDEFKDEVHFMMINLVDGSRETRQSGEAYITEHGYTFPVYFDTEQSAARAYGIRALPTTMFIDAEGNIVTWAEGALSAEGLRMGISFIVD